MSNADDIRAADAEIVAAALLTVDGRMIDRLAVAIATRKALQSPLPSRDEFDQRGREMATWHPRNRRMQDWADCLRWVHLHPEVILLDAASELEERS